MLKILERFRLHPSGAPVDNSPAAITRRQSKAVRHRGLNTGALRRNRAKAKRAGRARRINRKRATR
jgi:hypothetical protein